MAVLRASHSAPVSKSSERVLLLGAFLSQALLPSGQCTGLEEGPRSMHALNSVTGSARKTGLRARAAFEASAKLRETRRFRS